MLILIFISLCSHFDCDIYSYILSIVHAERSSWVQTTPGLLCPMKRKIALIIILRNKVNIDQSNEKFMSDQEISWSCNTVMTDLICQENDLLLKKVKVEWCENFPKLPHQ